MFELFASVTLTRDLPESGREAGEGGAVVEIYEDGAAYEVEFFDGAGETIALVLVPAEALRLTTDADRAARGPGRVAAE